MMTTVAVAQGTGHGGLQVGHNQVHLEELEADDPGAEKVKLALAG